MHGWLTAAVSNPRLLPGNVREKADDNFIHNYILPFVIILFSTCDLALHL